jgi:hypothetical protein
VAQFHCLGTTVTNQNLIHEEIKSRLNSWNSCYLSVQSLLSSRLFSMNLKIKIYKTVTLPATLCGCEDDENYLDQRGGGSPSNLNFTIYSKDLLAVSKL